MKRASITFSRDLTSSTQGRFTSVDSENAGADERDPQSWNGYSYTRNTPTILVDPDGREFQICYGEDDCHTYSDKQFNQIKADATKLGAVFKNNAIYNEVNGEMVVTGTYIRTDNSAMWDQVAPQLGARLEPAQKVFEVGIAIDVAIITGGTSLGSVGGTTWLGLEAAQSAPTAAQAIVTVGQGLKKLRSIGSGRLAGYLRGNTTILGGAKAAQETFRQLTGRDPVGTFDRVVQGGKEIVYKGISNSGQVKIEIVNKLGGNKGHINTAKGGADGAAAHDVLHFAGIRDQYKEGPRDANGQRTSTPQKRIR